jgi:Domain of unknown function (DUF5666)
VYPNSIGRTASRFRMPLMAKGRKLFVRPLCVSALAAFTGIFVDARGAAPVPEQAAQQNSAQNSAARPVGTIKSISGNTITLTTDAGVDANVVIRDGTRLVRVAPGQKDLKDASPIQLQELQVGDRLLIRGNLSEDGKSVIAASIVVMKKADIAEKQAHEREEWQRHGLGGLVNSVDPDAGTITIATNALGPNKDVVIRISKETILRRYAPDSVKFDEAKPGALAEIKAGDQLRARGTRGADGGELTADEIVSGSFRNIAGPITAIDPATSTISVQDLLSKKIVAVKITADSQLRKLPPVMAQRVAMRIGGAPADAASNATTPVSGTPRLGDAPAGGPGGSRPGGGDFQQAISRMPPASLSDLQKGDAVMVVATQGTQEAKITVITLLAGVEAILEASPRGGRSTILSPWSLSATPVGDAGGPQ